MFAANQHFTRFPDWDFITVAIRNLYLGEEERFSARLRPESCGKPFFFTEVKVADSDGNEVPIGEAGEMLVRGKHVMREYWNRPDATADTLVDGWLRTGDVGVMDNEGFFAIQDRIKDMIISGGENVYPAG